MIWLLAIGYDQLMLTMIITESSSSGHPSGNQQQTNNNNNNAPTAEIHPFFKDSYGRLVESKTYSKIIFKFHPMKCSLKSPPNNVPGTSCCTATTLKMKTTSVLKEASVSLSWIRSQLTIMIMFTFVFVYICFAKDLHLFPTSGRPRMVLGGEGRWPGGICTCRLIGICWKYVYAYCVFVYITAGFVCLRYLR